MGELTPVNRALVADAVVDQIKLRIVNGQLQRGDRLPPEHDLADKLGVGRNAIREALRTLEAGGWVQRSKRGTTVLASESDLLLGPFANIVMLQQLPILELFEVRRVLEGELAAMAAERATPEERENIGSLAVRLATPELTDEEFVEVNVSFHMAVAQASQNRLLIAILEGVRHLLVKTQRAGAPVREMRRSSIDAHATIAKTIDERNPVTARAAMHQHLQEVEAGLRNWIAQAEAQQRLQ